MFSLKEILAYNSIVIQCHDNPDADALASAFAVYTYLKDNGKNSSIIYTGLTKISKCNLQLMIEWLSIPVTYVREIEKPQLLICVDCQYGEGNVTIIEAETVAVIDHHLQTSGNFDLGIIQSQLRSCSTVVWDLLCREGFDFTKHQKVATALYYGLYTDTNNFSEISHPLDKDMRDGLRCDRSMVERLRFSNLTLDELEIAGVALLRNYNNSNKRYAVFKAEPCDPNILGFISDLGLQVNTVDVCVVYSLFDNGAKISVRSCTKEVMASEFAEYLTDGVGSGGGHTEKAGGFIQKSLIDAMGITISDYMSRKIEEYFESFDVIYSSSHGIDISSMKVYRRKPVPIGYIPSTELFEENTPVMIRALDGDLTVKVSSDMYIMVGVNAEVYPLKAERFRSYYEVSDKKPLIRTEYYPTVKNNLTGEVTELLPNLRACVSTGVSKTYIAPLKRNTKIFTEINPDGYIYGRPGDYLAVKCADLNDVYIVKKDIFEKNYEECEI